MHRLLLIPLLMLLTACAGMAPGPQQGATAPAVGPGEQELEQELLARLYRQHQEWRGTPYRIGGQGRDGVDCSGFVQLTYRSRLGLALPRTTGQQAASGRPVGQSELNTGDLVFFRIDGTTQHVGIYLEQNRFLHASKSRGVMISSLDSPYWQSVYWTSRRVL